MIEKNFINRHLGIKFNSYIDEECRVWFKGKEVAQILGYKKTEDAIKRHVSENHKKKFFFFVAPVKRVVNKMTPEENIVYLLMSQVSMN